LCVQATIGLLGHDTAVVYTLGTVIIGHHFWTMSGMEQAEAEINFFQKRKHYGWSVAAVSDGARKILVGQQD